MIDLLSLSKDTALKVSAIRRSLSNLGVGSFHDSIRQSDWHCLGSLHGFPSWLGFCMPVKGALVKIDKLWCFTVHSLKGFLEHREYVEFREIFECDLFPIANTASGALLAIDGQAVDEMTMVSINFEAQNCSPFKREDIYKLGSSYQQILDNTLQFGASYPRQWEFL